LLLLLAAHASSLAGEGASPESTRLGPVDLAGTGLTLDLRDGKWVATARDVEIRWTGARLRADRAVVWVDRMDRPESGKKKNPPDLSSGPLAVTVYAEGNVRVEWGEAFSKRIREGIRKVGRERKQGLPSIESVEALLRGEGEAPKPDPRRDVVTCERFLYDFHARKGVVVGARADLAHAFGKTPVPAGTKLVARAEEIRLAMKEDGSGTVRLKGLSVTDCEFFSPHYDFYASELRIEVGRGEDPDVWLSFRHLTPRAFGVPFFYFPWLAWNARWRPMIRLRPGRSAELGWFLRTAVGMEIKAPRPNKPGGKTRAGSFWLLGDWFEKRGLATGLEGEWGLPGDRPFRGESLLYFIHDRGDHRDVARDLGWFPLEGEDRWRTYLHHRHEIPALDARAEVEINAYSDPNFLVEFFEDEWKTEKPPESYAQYVQRWENHGATLLFRPRLNGFLSRVEYLPRLRYRGLSHPLPFGLGVLTLASELSHVRVRPSDREPWLSSERFWRADTGAEFALPFRVFVVEAEPFFRARYTAFGKTALGDGALDRVLLEGGVRATVRAWRDFFLDFPLLAVSDLRHVVTLQADYVNRFHVSRPSSDLIPVDEVERMDVLQRVDLRLVNRLETWRRGPAERWNAQDFLSLEVELPVYPDPDRDNAGSRFGPALIDLRLAPWQGFSFLSFSVVDVDRWAFDRWDAGLTLEPVRGLSLSVSTLNVPGQIHATTFSASVRFGERWSASFSEMYDFEAGREVYSKFRVRRILHRWVLEVGFHTDSSREDWGVSVSFLPLLAVPEAWE